MRPTTKGKIKLFASLFRGLDKAYGTYEPNTGRHWQIKKQVTQETIYNHLSGSQPYGFYPLVGERTHVGVADFDDGKSQVQRFLEKCFTGLTNRGRKPPASELSRGQRGMKKLIVSESIGKPEMEQMLGELKTRVRSHKSVYYDERSNLTLFLKSTYDG